mgnify:CR=1 FL=1
MWMGGSRRHVDGRKPASRRWERNAGPIALRRDVGAQGIEGGVNGCADGSRDPGRERLAVLEPGCRDPDEDHARREPLKRACELDGGGEPKRVCPAAAGARPGILRQGRYAFAGLEHDEVARLGSRRVNSVDNDDEVCPGHRHDEVRRVLMSEDPDAGQAELGYSAHDNRPYGVVPAVRRAEPDDERGRRGRHLRSIVRSRKWVAQEMQGS